MSCVDYNYRINLLNNSVKIIMFLLYILTNLKFCVKVYTLGIKIINPVINAANVATSTAAADISFTFFINLCISGDTKSDKFSKAEFNNSKINTIAIEKIIKTHSIEEILRIMEIVIAHMLAIK